MEHRAPKRKTSTHSREPRPRVAIIKRSINKSITRRINVAIVTVERMDAGQDAGQDASGTIAMYTHTHTRTIHLLHILPESVIDGFPDVGNSKTILRDDRSRSPRPASLARRRDAPQDRRDGRQVSASYASRSDERRAGRPVAMATRSIDSLAFAFALALAPDSRARSARARKRSERLGLGVACG